MRGAGRRLTLEAEEGRRDLGVDQRHSSRKGRLDGVDKELAFPNAVLALFGFPDKGIRERVFRIYNEYIADIQERSDGHFYGLGLINWWDPRGTERTLSELKSLGLNVDLDSRAA